MDPRNHECHHDNNQKAIKLLQLEVLMEANTAAAAKQREAAWEDNAYVSTIQLS